MANPRRVVTHEGIGFRSVTCFIDGVTIDAFSETAPFGHAAAGRAVGLVAGTEDMVELVGDGQAVYGRLDHVEGDGACVVQTEGQCWLPAGDGATLARGGQIVGDLGAAAARGYIRNVVAATAADLAAGKHEVIGIADAPQIEVMLGNA